MKKTLITILFTALAILWGCKDDSGGSNPFNQGNTASVTFTMQGQGNQSSYDFYFQPSVNVKITAIIATLAAQNYSDTVSNPNANYVFSKDSAYTWYPYSGVNSGQQWSFTFKGNVASDNSVYSSGANFSVP